MNPKLELLKMRHARALAEMIAFQMANQTTAQSRAWDAYQRDSDHARALEKQFEEATKEGGAQ